MHRAFHCLIFTFLFLLSIPRRPPTSPLFPYTTLFRSDPRLALCSTLAGTVAGDIACEQEARWARMDKSTERSEEHTSELQSRRDLVCRLLLEKKRQRPGHSGRSSTLRHARRQSPLLLL